MLLVQLGINSTHDVWKLTSLVLLTPNCTRHRMITHTNSRVGFFS